MYLQKMWTKEQHKALNLFFSVMFHEQRKFVGKELQDLECQDPLKKSLRRYLEFLQWCKLNFLAQQWACFRDPTEFQDANPAISTSDRERALQAELSRPWWTGSYTYRAKFWLTVSFDCEPLYKIYIYVTRALNNTCITCSDWLMLRLINSYRSLSKFMY